MNTFLKKSVYLGLFSAALPVCFSAVVIDNTSGAATANAFQAALSTGGGALGIQFTAGTSELRFSSVNLSLFDSANPANPTIRVRLYQDNGSDQPGTLLSTLVNGSGGTLTATPSTKNFTSASTVDFSSGQKYWIVLDQNGGAPTLSWAKSDASDGTAFTTANGYSTVTPYVLSEDLTTSVVSDSERPFFSMTTTVPEPHEYATFAGLGLVAFGAYRRRLMAAKA